MSRSDRRSTASDGPDRAEEVVGLRDAGEKAFEQIGRTLDRTGKAVEQASGHEQCCLARLDEPTRQVGSVRSSTRRLRAVVALGCLLTASPAAGQALRAPAVSGEAQVTARVRHVTTVVLPQAAEIVDVVMGDPEHWDVSAAAHLAFVRPLVPDARSNLVLLTAAGGIVPLLLVERDDAPVDTVVRVDTPANGAAETKPVLAAKDAAMAMARRAAEAWEAVDAAETRAAARVEVARSAARARLDAGRETYPRQARFDYRWSGDPAGYPWMVEGMWHDGRRTYLRTRAISPVLHERVEGYLEPVTVSAVFDDVLHVVPRVLGAGALEVDGERLPWSVSPRRAGP